MEFLQFTSSLEKCVTIGKTPGVLEETWSLAVFGTHVKSYERGNKHFHMQTSRSDVPSIYSCLSKLRIHRPRDLHDGAGVYPPTLLP